MGFQLSVEIIYVYVTVSIRHITNSLEIQQALLILKAMNQSSSTSEGLETIPMVSLNWDLSTLNHDKTHLPTSSYMYSFMARSELRGGITAMISRNSLCIPVPVQSLILITVRVICQLHVVTNV